MEKVPIGSRVEVLSTGNNWSKVKYCSNIGYMMTKFLLPEKADTERTLEERVTLLEKRVTVLEAYDGAVG